MFHERYKCFDEIIWKNGESHSTAHWYRRLWSKSQITYFTHIGWIIFRVLKVYRKPKKTLGNSWCLVAFVKFCALLEVQHINTHSRETHMIICVMDFLVVNAALLRNRYGKGRGWMVTHYSCMFCLLIDHEIFSTVILSLPLIQEGQLSVSGERMCTVLVNRLED